MRSGRLLICACLIVAVRTSRKCPPSGGAAAVAVNLERSREARAQELRHARHNRINDPAALHPNRQFDEAIDGVCVAWPKGQRLEARLRQMDLEARQRAETALRVAEWRAWLEPATMEVAREYLEFVCELREADAYATVLRHQSEPALMAAVARRWGEMEVLRRTAACGRRLTPPLAEAMEHAAADGSAPPLSRTDAPELFSLFVANVRVLLQQRASREASGALAERGAGGGPLDTGGRVVPQLAGWSRSLEWRLLRRLRSASRRDAARNRRDGRFVAQRAAPVVEQAATTAAVLPAPLL